MAKCYRQGTSNRNNELWGCSMYTWSGRRGTTGDILSFCKKAFAGKYKNMWITPVYFDDTYYRHTHTFFKEVGVELSKKGKPTISVVIKGFRYQTDEGECVERITSIKEVRYSLYAFKDM